MKVILVVLIFSVSAFGQTDVCKEIKGASGVNSFTFKPDGTGSVTQITDTIKLAAKSSFANVIVEVPAGTYTGEMGIVIDENLIGKKGLCLSGINKPIIKRTKFNEDDTPSIIKITGVSNIVVRGFELEGTLTDDNEKSPSGISVRNFSGKAISNIRIEDNFIHTIGHTYKNCQETNSSGNKITCGQAHGIDVNSIEELNKISYVYIERNKLHNLRLGESESLSINSNVSNFIVSENVIWDVDNIGIDIAGRQDSDFQATKGVVSGNKVSDLKFEPYRNRAYPFVAGIYVDGGTGLSWKESITIVGNTVDKFGIGISIGSENNRCNFCRFCKAHPGHKDCKEFCLPDKCKGKVCCSKVKVEYIVLEKNVLTNNQLYGMGIGKDGADQNSQTWNVRVIGNTITGNVLSMEPDHREYSQLHFGSLEPDSLKAIEIRDNAIRATGDNSLLVAVKPTSNLRYLIPSVSFLNNNFYADKVDTSIWIWGISANVYKSYAKSKLVDAQTNLLTLPPGVMGSQNVWKAVK